MPGYLIPSVLPDLADVIFAGLARGDVLFYDGGHWKNLGAGTAGQVLQSGGAGADPSWASPTTGVTDHAALSHLDYASAGHTGFAGLGVANTFTVGPQTVVADADGRTGFVARGHSATQTGNLAEFQRSDGVSRTFFDADGVLTIQPAVGGKYGIRVRDAGGNVQFSVSADAGGIFTSSDLQTAVGFRVTAFGAYVGVLGGTRFEFLSDRLAGYGRVATDQVAAATTPGAVTGKLAVYDSATGALKGYLPLYSAIT